MTSPPSLGFSPAQPTKLPKSGAGAFILLPYARVTASKKLRSIQLLRSPVQSVALVVRDHLVGGSLHPPPQQAQLSKFRNQEVDGNIPSTQHPESASKNTSLGTTISHHSGAAPEVMPLAGLPSSLPGHESDVQKLKDNQTQRNSASPQRRAVRKSATQESSMEHTPLHHQHQARVANKVGGEGGHGITSNTPGRSRLRVTGRPDDSPEKGSAVPEFRDWESDPSAADSFTGIFDKVSEEKQTSATKVPMIIDDSAYLNMYHHSKGSNKASKCSCFNWKRK